MTAPPKRRRFRFAFRLRKMFVVVTIFDVWLGWQLKILRERKAILQEIHRHGSDTKPYWYAGLESWQADPVKSK